MSQRNEEIDAVSQRCNIVCCSAKAQDNAVSIGSN